MAFGCLTMNSGAEDAKPALVDGLQRDRRDQIFVDPPLTIPFLGGRTPDVVGAEWMMTRARRELIFCKSILLLIPNLKCCFFVVLDLQVRGLLTFSLACPNHRSRDSYRRTPLQLTDRVTGISLGRRLRPNRCLVDGLTSQIEIVRIRALVRMWTTPTKLGIVNPSALSVLVSIIE